MAQTIQTASTAAILWSENQELARACLEHRFVQQLATGALPAAAFRHYVAQDAFFLREFARAYCLAAAKAPDAEGFRVFHSLAGDVGEELRLHQTYATQWGVDLRKVQPSVATRTYTDFLLATAWSRSAGVTAAAMAPCMRLYAWLGQQLSDHAAAGHAYVNWIRTYADPAFERQARRLEELVDRYADLEAARPVYSHALRCELLFFEVAFASSR